MSQNTMSRSHMDVAISQLEFFFCEVLQNSNNVFSRKLSFSSQHVVVTL